MLAANNSLKADGHDGPLPEFQREAVQLSQLIRCVFIGPHASVNRMTKILLLIALAIPPWLAAKLGAPHWALVLSAIPFFLLAMRMGDADEDMLGEASGTVGRWLFLLMGIGGLALGAVAWTLKGTSSLLGVIWWVLPVALIIFVVGIFRLWRE